MFKKLSALLLAVVLMTTISVPAFAAEFTPSVEAKAAPEAVPQIGADGEEHLIIVYNSDGEEIFCDDCLRLTALSKRGEASDDIEAMLDSAYEQLTTAASLTDLAPDLTEDLQDYSKDITVNDLVVRDLFDIYVCEKCRELLEEDGDYITIRFELDANDEGLAAVLHNVEETTWESIDNENIARDGDETVDISFGSLSPVAFLYDGKVLGVDPNAPNSPQTGKPDSHMAIWIAGGCIIVAGAAYILTKKRSAQKV